MSTIHLKYVQKEVAPNHGKEKGRLHLYDYCGNVGKDPFAIAAKINGNKPPRLNP